MPTSNPPPRELSAEAKAIAAADRAKAGAREGAGWLKDEAQRLYAGYAKQSKYFKMRSWIVGTYALVALASLAMALPPMNHIKAYVIPGYDPSSREFMVQVVNESGEPWTSLTLVLDDTWVFERDRLPPNENVQPKVSQFVRRGAPTERAPMQLRPTILKVKTDQGSYRVNVAGE